MPTLRFQCQILGCLCLSATALLPAGFAGPSSEELASDSTLWLSWAREQIEQGGDGGDTAIAWATVAAASHQIGDRVGYRQCIGKAVSLLKAQGVMNPVAGAGTMLGVADAQELCDDKEGGACVGPGSRLLLRGH